MADIRLVQKLGQNLLITPQLQQAIKLLQLSRLELQDYVEQQLSENPTLEESPSENTGEESYEEITAEEQMREELREANSIVDPIDRSEVGEADWDILARQQELGQQASSTKNSKNSNEDVNSFESVLTRPESLTEHLEEQLRFLDLDERELALGLEIIGNIDERGYFAAIAEDIADRTGCSIEDFEDMLDMVQRLDPLGVGARDLKECLLIQVRALQLKNGIVEKVIEHHMKDLEKHNYQAIAKGLKITEDQVIESVAKIVGLDPIPGRQFGTTSDQYMIPDVYVFKVAGSWVVSLNEDGLPKLKISEFYKDMRETRLKNTEKEYLTDKIKSAQWLIKSIQQRQQTILKVTNKIVERQKDFFDFGVQFLKPMILRDIADDIEMHESTVSRVTTNKYVHTPRGIFELKWFFNSPVSKTDGGDIASEAVKSMIKKIIDSEEPKYPHSDQKLVELLEKQGILLARRTVAKYREQLNIFPSSQRKRMK
ncbi:MAG: RNA polymerase factor sigma-54 [Pseudomonadota bacterium]